MEKIDRLGWAASSTFSAYGVRVGLRVSERSALSLIEECLPPGASRSDSPIVDRMYSWIVGGEGRRPGTRRLNIVYEDHVRIARSVAAGDALEALESRMAIHIADVSPDRVFVHAGVVGWKGRAIVIPGRSFSGKSTLVAELVRAGATYYSDEYAVIDRKGVVHPYPRPLALREKGGTLQTRHAVESLGGRRGTKPLRTSLVVVTQYRSGSRFRPRAISPGQGVLALLANTVSARRHPEAALAALQRLVAHAEILKGVRGEAAEAAESILGRLG